MHQDLGLLDDLSVAENIGVGGFRRSRVLRRIDWKAHDLIAEAVLTRLEIPVSPRDKVGSLPASHRAAVAIARALRDAVPGEGLMILDEATRSLPREELAHFHRLLRRVVESGTSVLMVSHNLEEVLTLSDRVTVLRDGTVAGAGLETASLTEADLARLMLGKTVDVVTKGDSRATGAVAAHIEGLLLDGHEPLSITVQAGEVVGVTGLPGTGLRADSCPGLGGGPPSRRRDRHRRRSRRPHDVSRGPVPGRRCRDGARTARPRRPGRRPQRPRQPGAAEHPPPGQAVVRLARVAAAAWPTPRSTGWASRPAAGPTSSRSSAAATSRRSCSRSGSRSSPSCWCCTSRPRPSTSAPAPTS